MKKLIVNIFIILFLISIYKDLYSGTDLSNPYKEKTTNEVTSSPDSEYDVVKIKIVPGDTVISIIERLNPTLNNFNIDEIITDFSTLNPNTEPNNLQNNRFYFFPKYTNGK
ncbi:hypothetical protein [Ornithinibacillus californiensis]|uniref:hypothetical protein n=1 Tax=Ornithinibacillus californiensis TaxID=161536 RepID=UPI00064DE4B5|nr:hypothetical protein [Ornithinibacillus californiensis]